MTKLFSQACENNKKPILDILSRAFAKQKYVLEIGSGTGQHAVFFAKELPSLTWQTSDLSINHAGINQWINDGPAPNLIAPIRLDVLSDSWPTAHYDAMYSANTAHIMPWVAVASMFAGVGQGLANGGLFCLYGPFKYLGVLDAQTNIEFDYRLQQQSAHQGIREFHDINQLAMNAGLDLREDNAMPANNRLIVWQKR